MHLVLLHALPFDSRMWASEVEWARERGVETTAPDLFDRGATVEAWAASVAGQLPEGVVVVAGCSVGGSVAIELSRLIPDRVASLVLVGAKPGVRRDRVARDTGIDLLERDRDAAWDTIWAPIFGESTPPLVIRRARAWFDDQPTERLTQAVRAFHERCDQTDFLAQWERPLHVISGEFDRTPPTTTTAALVDRPGRSYHKIGECGHYVNLEQPDEFRAVLASILAVAEE